MESSASRILGLLDDPKRVYQFAEFNEVDEAEFQYCKILHQIVFGEKGLVETLGPTWAMVNDPRFLKLEACFIYHRKPVFSGDAAVGRQYITEHGAFDSSMSDLQQYSEILGEGRHFHKKVTEAGYDPAEFHKESDETIWKFIKQECPNYFDRNSVPNKEAKTLFQLIKAELLAIIDDYAEVSNSDCWVTIDTLDVTDVDAPGYDPSVKPTVQLEVDNLEKALTHRAVMRATAVRLLNNEDCQRMLMKGVNLDEIQLTEIEREQLLHIVYSSDYPANRAELYLKLNNFLVNATMRPIAEREEEQLRVAKVNAQEVVRQLKAGEIQKVTAQTDDGEDPFANLPKTPEQLMFEAIYNNPMKTNLFLEWQQFEERAAKARERGETERADKYQRCFDYIKPIMEDFTTEFTEDKYVEVMTKVAEILDIKVSEVEETNDGAAQ